MRPVSGKAETMDCAGVGERMMEFLYGELRELERTAFEGHLNACNRCRRDLDGFTETRRVLRQVDDEEVPEGARARILEAARSHAAPRLGIVRSVDAGGAARLSAPARKPRRRWMAPTFGAMGAAAMLLLGLRVLLDPRTSGEVDRIEELARAEPRSAPVASPPVTKPEPVPVPAAAPPPPIVVGGVMGDLKADHSPKDKLRQDAARRSRIVGEEAEEADDEAPPIHLRKKVAKKVSDAPLDLLDLGRTEDLSREVAAGTAPAAEEADSYGMADGAEGSASRRRSAPARRPAPPADELDRVLAEAKNEAPKKRGAMVMPSEAAAPAAPAAAREAKEAAGGRADPFPEETRPAAPAPLAAAPAKAKRVVLGKRAGEAAETYTVTEKAPAGPARVSTGASAGRSADAAPDMGTLLARADRLFAEHRWKEAKEAYDELVRRFPSHADLPRWKKRAGAAAAALTAIESQ